MHKINIKFYYTSLIVVFIMLVFLLPSFCFAAELDTGINYAEDIGLGDDDPRIIVVRIIRVALGFLGIIAVGFIMYAGWLYMTSEGDESKVNTAKDLIKNALIGLIIILASFGIASFILGKLIGLGGAGGGGGDGPYGGGVSGGMGALGACSIDSVYPEPGQSNPEVARNTSIIVTFKEEVDPTTICNDAGGNNNGVCDSGEYILPDNIKIFHTNETTECKLLEGTCTSLVTDVNVLTVDNKTFVFMPVNYLGSSSEYIWYTVYLSNNILKESENEGIFSDCYIDYFEWTFEISNKVDLTSPQVKENNVFPDPDNLFDDVSVNSPSSQAMGSINIKNNPNVYTIASVGKASSQGESESATVNGTYTCLSDGEIKVSIDSENTKASVIGPNGVVDDNDVSDNIANLGCGLTLAPNDGSFEAGNSWTINVVAEKSADNLTIGNKIYTFIFGESAGYSISKGATPSQTAENIVTTLSSNTEVNVTSTGAIINFTAKVAGKNGNNIEINSNSIYSAIDTSGAFEITAMSGGIDSVTITTVNDKKDKPRNAVIQLNFNEAVMPTSVSGSATDVEESIRVVNSLSVNGEACSKDIECASSVCDSNVCSGVATLLLNNASCSDNRECKSFKCESGVCVGNYLNGNFLVSNVYRTVEFISDNKCGTNACGEDIYCLPPNSRLKVELNASSLETCSSDISCVSRSPYNTCEACDNCNANNKVCRDNGKNYPLSDLILFNGVMDVSLNSLDGNRDNDADGPVSYFNENNTVPVFTTGDNFTWSFFINDIIDLTPPRIDSTKQENSKGIEKPLNQGETGVNLANPIIISFSKLMMSSSLSTGSTVIYNGEEENEHKLINIWNYSNSALGYWISKENIDNSSPLDGEPDFTKAYIKHSLFSDATKFRTQVGSGIKDIYQNCFKPSDGPACSGISDSSPSCCSGVTSSNSDCP